MDDLSRLAPVCPVLVIGGSPLGDRLYETLVDAGRFSVHLLLAPDDVELAQAVTKMPVAVAVVGHDDVKALRYALAVAHLAPTVRIVVTISDRTIGGRVAELLPQAIVTSAADLAAPHLATGDCCTDG